LNRPVSYGGQAVIEGVMMRGPEGYAVAVRGPGGDIITHYKKQPSPTSRAGVWRWPLLRGVAALVDSVVVGVEALILSANEAVGEDEKITKTEGGLVVLAGFAIAIGLFVLLPTVVAGPLRALGATTVVVNLGEGLLRLAILVAYVAAAGRMPDMRRVYEYHGAEHKVINAYDAGSPIDPQSAARFGTAHPRCGTSFLLFVVVVSILTFSVFGWPNLWVRLGTRLALLPVVAGLAYELTRLGATSRTPAWRWLTAPGMWLQRLTTRQPDMPQLEVAAAALAALNPPPRDPAGGSRPAGPGHPTRPGRPDGREPAERV